MLAWRARASGLEAKLASGSLAAAAYGGLQDSAPRAAVVSLHARVASVGPDDWEDPSLAQIWGPRGADYVIPREGLAAFTIGRLPRDAQKRAVIESIGAQVCEALDGRRLTGREVRDLLPDLDHAVRACAISGRVHIRWDASSIVLFEVDRPSIDVEDARLDLARRFLHWYGPVKRDRFAWWAGIERPDATETLRALGDELADLVVEGGRRVMLASDVDALISAPPVSGVRLLPHSDPFLKVDADFVTPDPQLRLEIFPEPSKRANFWPVSGGLLVDGEIIGSWARQQRKVTVNAWSTLDARARELVEAEALAMPIGGQSKASVDFHVAMR